MNNVGNILGILCLIGFFIVLCALAAYIVVNIIQSIKEYKILKEEFKNSNNRWMNIKYEKPKPAYNGMSKDILIKCRQDKYDTYILGYYDNISEKFVSLTQDDVTKDFVKKYGIEWKYCEEV